MEVTRYKCDNCGKEVVDRTAENGWILLTGSSIEIRLYGSSHSPKGLHNRTDYCGLECLRIAFAKHLDILPNPLQVASTSKSRPVKELTANTELI